MREVRPYSCPMTRSVLTASRCKKAVNAEKRFTLHDAPLVLTVHLKRFSPLGRKIGHHVKYDERLGLQPFMSDGQFGPTYSLYGVICHAGGGPNSGHYLAHVKGRDSWYEMNDEMVTPIRCAPVNLKSAYMLFYIRDKGQALEAAITSSNSFSPALTPPNVRIAMKKRPRPLGDDKEEDMGVKTNIPFIGPQLPSPTTSSPSLKPSNLTVKSSPDPQAESIKKKIEAAKSSPLALQQLSQYASDEEDEKPGEQSTVPLHIEDRINALSPLSSSPPRTTTPSPSSSPQRPNHGIPAASFYAPLPPVNGSSNGTSSGKWNKKRKVSNWDRDRDRDENSKRPFGQSTSPQRNQNRPPRSSVNPYRGLSGGNNLGDPFHKRTYKHGIRTMR
jgi:ubiquitin carboxyl-terminal hydrolase 36/42